MLHPFSPEGIFQLATPVAASFCSRCMHTALGGWNEVWVVMMPVIRVRCNEYP